MSSRTYSQVCSVSKALDLVGERWTLLIVRDLLAGPMGYNTLLDGLPGLTTNLLAKRLKSVMEADVLEKRPAPSDDKSKALYALTPAGLALGPIIASLADWGREHGAPPAPTDTLNFRWLLLLFARHYKPVGNRWIVQLDCKEKSLQLRLGTPNFEGVEGTPMRPDLTIKAEAATYYALLFGKETPETLQMTGAIELNEGHNEEPTLPIWQDFLKTFQVEE